MAIRNIPTTINAVGLAEIRAYLDVLHKLGGDHFTDSMIAAWAAEAESALADGNSPMLEIKSRDSVSGHTETFTVSAAGVDSEAYIDTDEVRADRATGEWLDTPEFLEVIKLSAWLENEDDDSVHFDTYEVDGETRGIVVRWVD